MMRAFSQGSNDYQDVVYLKNGSIIRGIIIEQVPNKQYKIQTIDKSIFVYSMEEVEKIAREEIVNTPDNNNSIKDKNVIKYDNKESGFTANIELGPLLYSAGFFRYTAFSFRSILGGQLSKRVFLGAELGLDAGNGGFVGVPLGLALRVNMLNGTFVPIFDFSTGYEYFRIGAHSYYFTPNVGCKFNISEKASPYLKFGYYGNYVVYGGMLNGVNIKFGVEF